MSTSVPPRWTLANVYPQLDSPEFNQAFSRLKENLDELGASVTGIEALSAATATSTLAANLNSLLDQINQISVLASTIQAYIYSFVTTDSFNTLARRKSSELDQVLVEFSKLETRIRAWIGKISQRLDELTSIPGLIHDHEFWLQETAQQSKYLMSQVEEDLASELIVDGAHAWNKLQGVVTSQHTVDFELDGEVKKLPMPAIINLRSHPDAEVRKRGYETEMQVWESLREPLAAALNGIKGTVNTLDARRGREDALHSALDRNRIDRQTLEALLTAMRESFPMFRKYFQAKAHLLGKEKLPWWDLFAPVGKASRTFDYDEARAIILDNFARFSSELESFARNAFDQGWIDAEQRPGKRGGAFCMGVPGVKESRILLNFDGSLDTISTLAHELGHGFHNYCMFAAGRTELQRESPMTMNETASIMCETIVVNALLSESQDPLEKLGILDTALIGDSQVIVDIYSRYLFEKEVFERRRQAELSADDLCEIMERAQKETYGDGLDERFLHKYMWTWKPHYYYSGLSFYNFPYAFGLLFGTGLYAIYQQRGPDFVPDYKALLSGTGMAKAADLAMRFGIDIRKPDFWRSSLDVIRQRVDQFIELSG